MKVERGISSPTRLREHWRQISAANYQVSCRARNAQFAAGAAERLVGGRGVVAVAAESAGFIFDLHEDHRMPLAVNVAS